MDQKEKNAEIGIYIEFKGLHNIIQMWFIFLLSHELDIITVMTIMIPLVQFNLYFLENKQLCSCICNQHFKTELHYYLVREVFRTYNILYRTQIYFIHFNKKNPSKFLSLFLLLTMTFPQLSLLTPYMCPVYHVTKSCMSIMPCFIKHPCHYFIVPGSLC